jgi:CubicO group peptidase (beta-lactamase class C family)
VSFSSFRCLLPAAAWRLVIVACVPVRPLSAQGPSVPGDSALRVLVQRFVTDSRSAGVVVGLLDPSGEQRVAAYGTAGPGKLPLDGNSVFRIASMTKTFTASCREGRRNLS